MNKLTSLARHFPVSKILLSYANNLLAPGSYLAYFLM